MPKMDKGTYHGVLAESALDTNKNGTPLIRLTFNIKNRWDGAKWEPISDSIQRNVKLYLSDAAAQYSFDKLKSLGFNGDFKAPDFGEEVKTKGISLTCEHDTSDGKTYENWDLPFSNEAKEATAPEDDVIRDLTAAFQSSMPNSKTSAPADETPPSPNEPPI